MQWWLCLQYFVANTVPGKIGKWSTVQNRRSMTANLNDLFWSYYSTFEWHPIDWHTKHVMNLKSWWSPRANAVNKRRRLHCDLKTKYIVPFPILIMLLFEIPLIFHVHSNEFLRSKLLTLYLPCKQPCFLFGNSSSCYRSTAVLRQTQIE